MTAMARANELRLYFPTQTPGKLYQDWQGKLVTITKWQVAFEEDGKTGTGERLFKAKWFGFVKEFDKSIPEEDLLKPKEWDEGDRR